jgi:nitroreductase
MSETFLSPQQVVELFKWRYATKTFDPSRKISDADWKAIEECLVLTPSSFGLQPWKFFVVDNAETRQALLANSWNQVQVVDASHLVVLAIKTEVNDGDVDRYLQSTMEARQVTAESLEGFGKVMKGFLANPKLDKGAWAEKQVYIALGQLMSAVAIMGIDACPMEGFNPVKYDEILGLTAKGYRSVLVCPVGYRSSEDKYGSAAKVRYSVEAMVEHL